MSWGWEHRDTLAVRELLADDFTFAFAQTDSSGDAYAGRAMTRDQFLRCVRHLFVGGGAYPPAQRIVLYFDPSLIALPDVRPGKTSQWHQEVRTSVDLTIDVGWQVYRVTGYARFFLVRGDSARIPPDLVARGLHPDAGRWYLERWEDESGSAAAPEIADAPAIAARPAEPVPTRNTTWGQIIALYR
jgi:hypothetical protein